MITIRDYFMGRDKSHAADLTLEIRQNAADTVRRVNLVLQAFGESRKVRSGWRPPAINAATPNAAKTSGHMVGTSCDLDDDEGDLGEWCMENLHVLEKLGLWIEHPAATKGWCHLQTVPPKSGRRVYYP